MNRISHRQALTTGLIIILMTAGALLAFANGPESAGNADPAVVADTPVGRSHINQLKVNQAEMAEKGETWSAVEPSEPVLSAMSMEINVVLDEARLQVAAKQEQFDKEPNAEAAMVIMRQIEALKTNAELDILKVQMRHARDKGQTEVVSRIEAALSEMTTPRPRKQPVDRPAPDAGLR